MSATAYTAGPPLGTDGSEGAEKGIFSMFKIDPVFTTAPKVARGAQPWAERWNGVGVLSAFRFFDRVNRIIWQGSISNGAAGRLTRPILTTTILQCPPPSSVP